ncbi:hypothetical protein, partial [Komagataeibacter rhaeticus]|uniref:hypothetical protein n=1 Tax=Komagataeibacter rhaeticus TaxID=215221 RepID=UPI0039EB7D38
VPGTGLCPHEKRETGRHAEILITAFVGPGAAHVKGKAPICCRPVQFRYGRDMKERDANRF